MEKNVIESPVSIVSVDMTLTGATDHYSTFDIYMEDKGFTKYKNVQTAWYMVYASEEDETIGDFLKWMGGVVPKSVNKNVGGRAIIQIGNQCIIIAKIRIIDKDSQTKIVFSYEETLVS